MAVNEKAKEETVPTAFRLPKPRRLMLEAISSERRHPDLSTTLNEAVDRYVEEYLRSKAA